MSTSSRSTTRSKITSRTPLVAVPGNMPFGGGGLLRRLRDKPLPAWAAEIDCANWSQVMPDFELSPSVVTCVIRGSRRGEHMAANAAAGSGLGMDARYWQHKMSAIRAWSACQSQQEE